MFQSKEMGRYLFTSCIEPLFSKTGTTLAVLRVDGKIPVWIERLKIFAKISEISIKTVLRIVFGILQGPKDLGPKQFMIFVTSFLWI